MSSLTRAAEVPALLPKEVARVRLIVWNCAMALHRKWEALERLEPDVAVVAECARPARVANSLGVRLGARDALWIGRLDHKGLAVFTFGKWRAELDLRQRDDLEYVLPAHVSGPASFLLLGVWALNHRAKRTPNGTRPGRQVQLGVERYAGDGRSDLVVAGDFNNNVLWDRQPTPKSMRNCIETLTERGLTSAYHRYLGETFGSETRPTLFWEARGGTVNTYHVDYAWLPSHWTIESVEVGSRVDWYDNGTSDHTPITVTATIPRLIAP